MITIDTSVAMWFKSGERFGAAALDLLGRIQRREVEAAANEIVSLEVVRGLKNAQGRQPALGITDAHIEQVFAALEAMFQTGVMLACSVSEVRVQAKDIELRLGLFMADALHMATAVYLQTPFFVADDAHFQTPNVISYAAGSGVRIVTLPDLIAALDADAGTATPPSS